MDDVPAEESDSDDEMNAIAVKKRVKEVIFIDNTTLMLTLSFRKVIPRKKWKTKNSRKMQAVKAATLPKAINLTSLYPLYLCLVVRNFNKW